MNPRSTGRRAAAFLLRTLLLALAIAVAGKTLAAERLVLMEKYSASWCPHCKNSSQVIGPLIDANPDDFITFDAFIDSTSLYVTEWGATRGYDFFGVSSYPTVFFDSALYYQGDANGDHEALQNIYQQGIDSRAAVPTDVVIDISALPVGGGMYDVTTTVSVEPGGSAKTMLVHLIQALDNYGQYNVANDPSVTVAHNTVMQSVEDGFDVTLSPGQSQQFTRTMQLGSTSLNQFEDIRLIAWAQDPGPASVEVFNAAQSLLSQAHPADYNDDGVVNAADIALWENEFGTTGLPHEGADGNGDGQVDGADFLFAQRHFGVASNGGAALAATAAVPEPAAALLLAVGLFAYQASRWRRRIDRRYS